MCVPQKFRPRMKAVNNSGFRALRIYPSIPDLSINGMQKGSTSSNLSPSRMPQISGMISEFSAASDAGAPQEAVAGMGRPRHKRRQNRLLVDKQPVALGRLSELGDSGLKVLRQAGMGRNGKAFKARGLIAECL